MPSQIDVAMDDITKDAYQTRGAHASLQERTAQDAYKMRELSETTQNAWMSSMAQSPISNAAEDCMDDCHFSHIMGCCT